ncbi:MAG TPA: hypothetical protein VGC54_08830 [Planctomycetota bacterium]
MTTTLIDRLGTATCPPRKLRSTVKRIPTLSTRPTWPETSTISPTSKMSAKTSVMPVTTSCTKPCKPKPTARPTIDADARYVESETPSSVAIMPIARK